MNFRRLSAITTVLLTLSGAVPLAAQRIVKQPQQVVTVSKGASALLVNPVAIQRFSIGDPAVAEAVVVSPTEVLINGKDLGTTSLLLWDNVGAVKLYSVEVTADANGLQRYLQSVLPDQEIDVTASGNTVTLSGEVRDASVANRAVEIATASGATIIDNLTTPTSTQVLLQVRFAEVNRTALSAWQSQISTLNPHRLNDNGDWVGSVNTDPETGTFVDGLLHFGLFNPGANVEALIRALKERGLFKSLAEPALVTLPGQEAYFLAGGEFPFPILQGGAAGFSGITIVFKEFGIRLRFTPTITRSGSIRLKVAPEVSSLDFGNALVVSGFTIPSIITRRAETVVEMREGQYLSIAGLFDSEFVKNTSKIPILGDIPIIGQFFRSENARQRRTELLVLITPRLIQPSATPDPVPTGEPETWDWDGSIEDYMEQPSAPPPQGE